MPVIVKTERLILRTWKEEDRVPFAQLNADPEVRKYFPNIMTREESDKYVDSILEVYDEYGYCTYATELKQTGEFIGFIGLNYVDYAAPFTPCVEIGWRLSKDHWNKGLATEGAAAVLDYGFNSLGFSEILSWTAVVNTPSRRVMEKIGMTYQYDFDHPRVAEGHWIRPHVLYKKQRNDTN